MSRTDRIAAHLTTCSTTPRTSRQYVESLAADVRTPPYYHLYEEGKLALMDGKVEEASALFRACPKAFRRTQTYLERCDTLATLYGAGVIHSTRARGLAAALAQALYGDVADDDAAVAAYAERLAEGGFTRVLVDEVTLFGVDALRSAAAMTDGHRLLLERHAAKNSAWWERWAHAAMRAVERCGGADACVSRLAALAPRREGVVLAREEEEEDETASD